MIIDPSALMAILLNEPGAINYSRAIANSQFKVLSGPGYLETCMVFCGRRDPSAIEKVEALVKEANITICPFGGDAARVAAAAFLVYGKGRGHPAQLNFGDCISYAMSKVEAMPLLFKGNDFIHTDVESAL